MTDPCTCDPNDLFNPPDPRPRAVADCPAHRARRAAQQFTGRGVQMSALHDRLLARVDDLGRHLAGCVLCTTCEASALTRALRAVLELHHPRRCACREGGPHIICSGCPGHEMHERCHTVRAIARELGVTHDRRRLS